MTSDSDEQTARRGPDTSFAHYLAQKEAEATPERRVEMDASRAHAQALYAEHFGSAAGPGGDPGQTRSDADAALDEMTRRLTPGFVEPAVAMARAAAAEARPVPAHTLAYDSVSPAQAESLLRSRRLVATRSILDQFRTDIIRILTFHKPGHPPVTGAVADLLALLGDAEKEVAAAELGCGQEDGECLCPCHAGILNP